MDNSKFYKNLNEIEYSDKEVEEYISLCKISDEEIKKISGAVKTQYSIDGIKAGNKLVSDMLDKDEKIEKIIKIKDLHLITMLTVASALGGTIGKSNDYSVYNDLYFSNKRIFFVYDNYANQPITSEWINREDILGVKFTNKKLEVKKDKKGNNVKLKSKIKIISTIIYMLTAMFTVLGVSDFIQYGLQSEDHLIAYTAAFVLCSICIYIKDKTLDGMQIVLKDGRVIYGLIGSDDYKECKKYLIKLGKDLK